MQKSRFGAVSGLLRATLGARLPRVEGTLKRPGVRDRVTIRRDANGVAYVEASCDEDAFYGMGFCQGQDRAFQIELYVRVARGTLSEIIGAEMLPVDRLSRRLGLTHIARAQLALAPENVRMQFDAFARGLNDGMRVGGKRLAHEFALLRTEPSVFESADILAILQFFAFALSSNWDAELARLRVLQQDGPEALAAIEASDPSPLADRLATDVGVLGAAERLLDDAIALMHVAGLGGASNQWALAPSRTSTGRPILASDPHLSPTLPAPWYLMHIRTPTWALSGACLPSQPIVSFGHNEHVAWCLTAGHADNTDLFVERLGEGGASALVGDTYQPCTVRDEIIKVKGAADVHERVLVTRHGPIVSAASPFALSMRGSWMAHRQLTGYDLYLARSVDDARMAYASYPAVSENRVMADVNGHILSQMVGDVPVRKKGNGMLPMPGWDPEVGWEDAPLPFDDLPMAKDPGEGFLASANNRPLHAKSDVFLGADWLDGYRYARIVECLASRSDWDVASTQRLQLDQTSILWRTIRESVLDALRGVDCEVGFRLLERWDGVVAATSSAAAVFELFLSEMMWRSAAAKAPRGWRAVLGDGTNAILPHGMMGLRRVTHLARCLIDQPAGWFAGGWRVEMQSALLSSVKRLRDLAGDDVDAWAWGRVRPLVLLHPVGSKAAMDRIFNIGPLRVGGDATTIPQASVPFTDPLSNPIGIANLRMVIDVGNWEASRYVLAGGQSGNPLSPHYRDQVDRWMRGEGIPIAWTRESVRAHATATLELLPE
ncbi:MAG: penicillin acylase family protein [Polyangiales bacterium]